MAENTSAQLRSIREPSLVRKAGPATGRILLIDDDNGVRSVLAMALRMAGYTVTEAREGKEGIDHLRAARFDLIVTDLTMPGQEGIETIVQLQDARRGAPVIAISGDFGTSPHFFALASKYGVEASLSKPFNIVELMAAVAKVMAAHPVAAQP